MAIRQGVFDNNFCAVGESFSNCLSLGIAGNVIDGVSTDWSVLNPGTCSCPSDCTNHGSCQLGLRCNCDAGYGGVDCASIRCSEQTCSNRGTCTTLPTLGFDSCVCQDGFALGDCSAKIEYLPEIPPLLPYPQYSDWDEYGDNNPIFNESTIAQVHLTISQEDLNFLINPVNANVREYKHANFSFYNGATSQRFEDVGMRIKGGASRYFSKKSWKISFNTFEKGRSWAQQKKLVLKDASMDALYVREKASISALKAMGAPAQRSSYAVVYVNGMIWGLYLLLEDPARDEYLDSRFGNSKGSLWKCQANLQYISDDPDAYRDQGYKPMTDHAEESFEPLANFIEVLNLTPDDQFEEQIQTVMDVEFFLRTLAVEVATGNWDGIYNSNNYCLYYNTDGLFYYYRYDLDISFGSLDFFYRGSNRPIWTWASAVPPGSGQLLPDRILAVSSFQEMYSSYLSKLLTYVNLDMEGPFQQMVNRMHRTIQNAVSLDKWHSLDQWMYSEYDFERNLFEAVERPAFWPPNNLLTTDSWKPFLGFNEFIKIRNQVTEEDLQSGPPQ